jgi:(p)ppGpp synthase/HD superfamily hydrolase
MSVEVQVRDVEHLYRVMARLSGLNGVQEVQRG